MVDQLAGLVVAVMIMTAFYNLTWWAFKLLGVVGDYILRVIDR